jgi:putative NADH-flavin reductase
MKIVVLGATGRTGRLVVEQAFTRGDQVVAYVRNTKGIAANPALEIIAGQLGDVLALRPAINGADAVLVCLGTHGKRMKKHVDLMQTSMLSIITAMQQAQVARLVLESAYGVAKPLGRQD